MKKLFKVALLVVTLFSLTSTYAQEQVRFQLVGTNRAETQKKVIPEGRSIVCKPVNGRKLKGKFYLVNERELTIDGQVVPVSSIRYIKKFKPGNQATASVFAFLAVPMMAIWAGGNEWLAPFGKFFCQVFGATSATLFLVDQQKSFNLKIEVHRVEEEELEVKI